MTSIRGRLATHFVRLIGFKKRLRHLAEVDGDEQAFHTALRRLRRTDSRRPPWTVRRSWTIEQIDVDGFDLFVMSPKGRGRSDRLLLYLHGGGYMFGPFVTEWAAMRKVAVTAPADFAMLMYPRAPEHDARTTLAVARAAYDRLAVRYGAGGVILVGTSAGGGLAIALMAALRDDGGAQAACAVLLSPGVDMTLRDDVSAYEDTDVMLPVEHVRSAGEIYAGDVGADHPIVSPLFGDLADLPSMHIFVGGAELLRPSLEAFAAKATDAGTEVQVVVGDNEQHTWPLAPIPEGRMALEQIVDVVRDCV